MREISATKQKILIFGLVGVLILAIVMIVVMFMSGKDAGQEGVQIVDNSAGENVNQGGDGKVVGEGDEAKKDGNFLKMATGDIYGLKMKEGTNQIMFYQQQKMLSADPFTGQKYSIGNYPFSVVTKFLWSKDSDKVLVKDTGDYYVYDVSTNLANMFRYEIDNAIWNKEGNKIIYKYYNKETGKRKIKIADVNGENGQLIVDGLSYRKINLMLQPGVEKLCYAPFPDARFKGKLFCSSLNGQNKKEYGGQYGQDYLWSPDGSKLLTSFTKEDSGNTLVLGVMSKTGGEAKGLSLGTTVKKCVWSKNNVDVYCAVLGGAPLAIMLPNAWYEELFHSVDTFWKINTKTGEKQRLVGLDDINSVIDSENLVLDSEESFLFFVSRRDRSLWRLKL